MLVWRPSFASLRRAFASVVAAACLGGCAPTAGLLDALQHNYAGYEELSPKLSPGGTGASFPYTPGTILPALAQDNDSAARTWLATTDLRCGPSVALRDLSYWQRKAYYYRAGTMAGIDAKSWLEKRAGSGLSSLAGVSDVIVTVSNVRSYEPNAKMMAELNARAGQGCVLPAGFGTIRRVRAVIVGDVRVRVAFEQGIDLLVRKQIGDQLGFALGFAFQRGSEQDFIGRDVAFGVKWQ